MNSRRNLRGIAVSSGAIPGVGVPSGNILGVVNPSAGDVLEEV